MSDKLKFYTSADNKQRALTGRLERRHETSQVVTNVTYN